jgi:hypothetical protein
MFQWRITFLNALPTVTAVTDNPIALWSRVSDLPIPEVKHLMLVVRFARTQFFSHPLVCFVRTQCFSHLLSVSLARNASLTFAVAGIVCERVQH